MSLHQTAPAHSRKDWQTPERVLDLVRQLGPIGLDPCTSDDNPTGAASFLTQRGLEASWTDRGLVFCNPPYGREIGDWISKCNQEGNCAPIFKCEVIALVPANTDTKWYASAAQRSHARCEVEGRLRFKGAPAPAMFGSAVFYWGHQPFLFAHIFSALGRCYVR